jgi:hypothetical protein
MNKKKITSDIISFIVVVIILFVCYKLFIRKEKEINDFYDAESAKKELLSIQKRNNQLGKEIAENSKKQAIYENKIDSLQKLKPKIKIQYVQVEKKIDSEFADSIISEFKSVFAKNSIE